MKVKKVFLLVVFTAVSHYATSQGNVEAIRNAFLDPASRTVLVAAHRAVHSEYPENSLNAIEAGIRLGVDFVEIDVKVSKDGVPFLMHDHTLDRTTTGKGEAEALTWEALQQLSIVDKGRITTYKIPKLEDALRVAKGNVMLDLDLKTDRIDKVIDVVNRTGTGDIVVFFDSDFDVLSRVQQADDDFFVMPRAHSTAEADSVIDVFDPPIVHIDFSFYTSKTTQLIEKSAARIWINALGSPDEKLVKGRERRAVRMLTRRGANVIQTNEPALLLSALRRHGLHP